MHAFEYHRPASIKDAACVARRRNLKRRSLAGGQTLVQAMKLRLSSPTDLIDLGSLKELAGIKVSDSRGHHRRDDAPRRRRRLGAK